LASLVQLQSLRQLNLTSVPKGQLSALGALTQLTWLQVGGLEVGAAGAAVKQAAGLTRLRHLWLLGDGVQAGGLVQLCGALQHLTALRLQLRDTQWAAQLEAAAAAAAALTATGGRSAAAAAATGSAGAEPQTPAAVAAAGARPQGLLACLQQLRCLQQCDLGLQAGQHKQLMAALQLPGVGEIKL
jgi:hypothetical protein